MPMATGFRETILMRYVFRIAILDAYTAVKEDNNGTIWLANEAVITPNTKHVNARHHFLRGRVANGEFKVTHVPSEEQRAMLSF